MIIEVCNFLRRYSFFSKRFRRLWVAVDSLIAVSNLLKGKPSSTFLNAVVWSVEDQTTQVDETTFSDVAGLYWVSPLIPFRDSDLQNAQSIIDDVLSRYDFDTAVTYSLISSRCIQGIVSIHFDKRNQQATQRAKDAYESLTAALLEAGYPPYRLNVDSMHFFQKYSRTYLETMQALKAAIDPLGHMMGGRYQPKLSSDVP